MKTWILVAGLVLQYRAASAQEKTIHAEEKAIKEIGQLARDSRLIAAFKEIDRLNPAALDELIRLTEIPAPPFRESLRGASFMKLLEGAGGVQVGIDSVGNVLALRKGKKSERVVAIDGHLDTVFPEGTDVRVRKHGDTLFAPGIGDNTRGLIVVLTVLRAMQKANIQTNDDILFVATVGEEGMGDLRGVKYLFRKGGPMISSWISIDNYGTGDVFNAGTGALRYRATVAGPGGHSWIDFGLANPHHALAKMINLFSDEASRYTAGAKAKTSFNVGIIGGGTSVNSIPFESWMEVDMRSEADKNLRTMDSIFKSTLQKGLTEYNSNRKTGPALTLKIKQVGFRPSGTINSQVPLIQRSLAVVKYFGLAPELKMMSGNANWPISKGIPAVTLGWGGKGDHAHSLDEWWLDDKGTEAIKQALLTLVAEAGLAKK